MLTLLEADIGSLGGKAGNGKGSVGVLKDVRDAGSETADVDCSGSVEMSDG